MAGAGKLFRVTAREAEGFKDYRRAGIAWPRGIGNYLDVLVVDTTADPPGREIDGQLAIGQETFALIQDDKHLFVTNADDGGASAAAGEKLVAENASLKARVAELEQLLEKATNPGGDEGKGGGKSKGKGAST